MRSVRKFLLLSGREKLLLFEALLLLSTTRTALALLPFQAVRRFLDHFATPKRELPGHAEAENIVWATQATARRFPGVGTCLTQALTAYVLLARIGYQTDFRIGE
jgi:Transglutaminase-like superfamily